jgi:hypothetical protein
LVFFGSSTVRGWALRLDWSGQRESNPHSQLGRLELYH